MDLKKNRKSNLPTLLLVILLSFGCAKKVTPTSDNAGNGPDLKGKNPLMILDGEEIADRSVLHSIDPNTIEYITVLKEESAITKYGKKAKDGAVIIVTKQYEENRKKELYNQLQTYLKEATGEQGEFFFVLDGIVLDASNMPFFR